MSRSDQWVGLTDRAEKWLERNCTQRSGTITTEWSDGERNVQQVKEFIHPRPPTPVEGAWNEVAGYLHTYLLRGDVDAVAYKIEEFVQAEPWSSGPLYFIGLRYVDGGLEVPRVNWTKKEIQEML